ncbi:MAG: MutS-related protein, partial [Gaiellaceae bacterium]
MRFPSILYDDLEDRTRLEGPEQPPFFTDLNLDQVLEAITTGREEYDLAPFFYAPLHDVSTVEYRQEVMRDLERPDVVEPVRGFARSLQEVRRRLAQAEGLHDDLQRQRWFLDAVGVYCGAVGSLTERLGRVDVGSRGLGAFRDYLRAYTESERFGALAAETEALLERLAEVRYAVHIKGNRVRVSRYEDEADYSAEVEATFAKFKQGGVRDRRVDFPDPAEVNHVEARVLARVARLYPEVFGDLAAFRERHADYLDPAIGGFDREVQLYLAYLEAIEPLKARGLAFCYPRVSRSRETAVRDGFDLALARKLTAEGATVVCNDFALTGPERAIVVTGPNQGGKTTFARMFGQLHHLAALGLPVPAREASLVLPDRLFTHFEREEDLDTLRGKLEDELVRIHEVLEEATCASVLVMNESFTSTTLQDALFIGAEVVTRILDRDMLCVYVTFVDELASLNGATVSVVATVAPDDPSVRTFRV